METKNILIKDVILISPIGNNENESNNWDYEKIYEKTSILIENDKIAEISKNISMNNVDKVIDGTNKILMPGLINTHTHAPMNLFRGLADDLELNEWLSDYIWPMESRLNSELSYIGSLLSNIEMIKSGTTTFNDMYFHVENIAKSVEESGIRANLSYGMIDFGDEEKKEKEIKENIKLIKNWNNRADGRIKTLFGPHSPYTASEDLLKRVRKEADKYKVRIHIHMNETKKEVDNVLEATKRRPFEYLNDIGFLKEDVTSAHGVWLSDEEIAIIKENNVKISHNPCSNMKLSSGIAPVDKLIKNNICVSLGTDGAASNNNLDLFEEMKFASLLQKVNTMNPKILPADLMIEMATINGAKSLGLEKEIGSIEIGKKADLILINTKTPNLTPNINSLVSHIVYSANGGDVDTTICNGKILMENRKIKTINEQEILEKVNNLMKNLKDSLVG
jgi:5-methylthioadenosine/S-adenosylhomocysteine deaminase